MKEETIRRPIPASQPRKSRDVFYFAHTRTASHVLCRLLSTQTGWEYSDYHFKRAFDFARDTFGWGPLNDASKQHRNGFENLLQEGFDEILSEREAAASKVSPTHSAISSPLSGPKSLTARNRTNPSSSKNTHSTHGSPPSSHKVCGAYQRLPRSPPPTKAKNPHRTNQRRTQQSSRTPSSPPSAPSS